MRAGRETAIPETGSFSEGLLRLLRAYLNIVSRWHWSLLLGLLVAMVVLDAAMEPDGMPVWANLAFSLMILLGAIFTANLSERWTRVGTALVLIWAAVRLAEDIAPTHMLDAMMIGMSFAITAGALALTFQQLFTLEDTLDAIFGAIFGYILIALTWGLLYHQIELWTPGAFDLGDDGHTRSEFVYFSLVTVTTLGYGDVLPISPLARILSGLQAVFGTLYVAIFIGRLVGQLGPPQRGRAE